MEGGFIYHNGAYYFGQWNSFGRKHKGMYYSPEGTQYKGDFSEGLPDGFGTVYFSDGARFEGEFKQGWFHGKGSFVRVDGMKYTGEFRGGQIWGNGVVSFKDGTSGFPRNEGYFKHSRFFKSRKCLETAQDAQKIAFFIRNSNEK